MSQSSPLAAARRNSELGLVVMAAGISAAAVALAFAVHVATGGAYEMRTVGALALRLLLWIALAQAARRALAAT